MPLDRHGGAIIMTTEPLPAAGHAEHVTGALRRSGVLADGRVSQVTVESARPTVLSRIVRLRLTYDGVADGAPGYLILKIAHPERVNATWYAGRQEVAFYNQVAAATPGRLVPRCFDAAWDEATNAWHLLLEDLTETHRTATAWPLPPPAAQCEIIIDTWARFHATWWDDPRLGVSVGAWSDDLDAYLQRFAGHLAGFADRLGDRLPKERRDVYDRFLGAAPRLSSRYRTRRHLTIIHGDSHVWNCLVRRDGSSDDVRLFDWDSWRIDTATDDLAYMIAMHWYPDRRRRLERSLLDRYHDWPGCPRRPRL
jgi:Ser/Thr protein kinase RdoA (MazF antagonist)